jgi:mRNA interferase RelE/StbE
MQPLVNWHGWISPLDAVPWERIHWLAANLDSIKPEALTGDLAGLYKLCVGDYRVVYEILHDEQTIVIHLIGHRREVYKRR